MMDIVSVTTCDAIFLPCSCDGNEPSPLAASCQLPLVLSPDKPSPLTSPSSSSSPLPQSSNLPSEPILYHPPSLASLATAALAGLHSVNHSPSSSVSDSSSSIRRFSDSCSDASYYLGSAKRPRVALSSTEGSRGSPSLSASVQHSVRICLFVCVCDLLLVVLFLFASTTE